MVISILPVYELSKTKQYTCTANNAHDFLFSNGNGNRLQHDALLFGTYGLYFNYLGASAIKSGK